MKFSLVFATAAMTLNQIAFAGEISTPVSYSAPESVPTPAPSTYTSISEEASVEPCDKEEIEEAPTPMAPLEEEVYAVNDVKPCNEVSIEGDATYCIEEDICTGDGNVAEGVACPVAGDIAISDCRSTLMSWIDYTDGCVAPMSAKCVKLDTGSWGCAYPGTAPYTKASALMSTAAAGRGSLSTIGVVSLVVASLGLAVVAAMLVWRQRKKSFAATNARRLANEMNAQTPVEPYSRALESPV